MASFEVPILVYKIVYVVVLYIPVKGDASVLGGVIDI